MKLSKESLSKISTATGVVIPNGQVFELPERVIQFGTGVLLRGLPDYYIDKANRNGIFNGRVIIVKSTDRGSTESYGEQDGLFTLCVRGIENGQKVDEKIVNSSISRVLSATTAWNEILASAANKDLQVLISNTTETGIRLMKDDKITANPPVSFPGKVVAFLYERYKKFNGSAESGMVILPTELIPNNGQLLKEICVQIAQLNECDQEFIDWMTQSNDFCNTLVDRIVPGALPPAEKKNMQDILGFEDDLMIMAEPYSLWAIETSSKRTKNILSFSKADPSVILAKDINKYREIKLRLLNAPHTFSCALAVCCGFSTVKQAMQYPAFRSYLYRLMTNELIPALIGEEIDETEAKVFASKVLDRFANPFIDHEWLNISMNFSSKMLMRCVPLLLKHYERFNNPPGCIALGFASYILFMNSKKEGDKYMGTLRGKTYVINDEKAAILNDHWKHGDLTKVVNAILTDKSLWNKDLTKLYEFEKLVLSSLQMLMSDGYQKLLHKELITL